MKNLLKKVSFLFALVITLSLPISAAQASTCPPHRYFHNGTFQVPVSRGEHQVEVQEWDPIYGGYRKVMKTCKITAIVEVYEYNCNICFNAYRTDQITLYETHSVNHPF